MWKEKKVAVYMLVGVMAVCLPPLSRSDAVLKASLFDPQNVSSGIAIVSGMGNIVLAIIFAIIVAGFVLLFISCGSEV